MILKKGIQVKVITGKDKGKTGEILEINRIVEFPIETIEKDILKILSGKDYKNNIYRRVHDGAWKARN